MLLNFELDPPRAFLHGFSKGLTAPVSLFAVHEAPGVPNVQPVMPPVRDAQAALNVDWMRIGQSFWVAVRRHEPPQK